MSCDLAIHDEFIYMEQSSCPFCDQQLIKVEVKSIESCCDKPDIINDNGKKVCKHCGLVDGYEQVKEYVNFYENIHRIRRKSVYHRKYHVENASTRQISIYHVIR